MMPGNNHSHSQLSSSSDVLPLNDSCMHIHYKFKEYNWEIIKNTNDQLVYVKPNYYNDCDEFKLEFISNKIFITIPVLGKNISYKTHFNSYFMAYEYVSLHLENYEQNANFIYSTTNSENNESNTYESF
jgi:hypothetical protein